MKRNKLSIFVLLAFTLVALPLLVACETEEGPAEEIGEGIDDVVDDLQDGGEDLGDQVEDAADEIEDAAEDVKDELDGDGS